MTRKEKYEAILYGILALVFIGMLFQLVMPGLLGCIGGPSASFLQGFVGLLLLILLCEGIRRIKTFPEFPWWVWLVFIVALDCLQFVPYFLRLGHKVLDSDPLPIVPDTLSILLIVFLGVWSWTTLRKNPEHRSDFIRYGILAGFLCSGWAHFCSLLTGLMIRLQVPLAAQVGILAILLVCAFLWLLFHKTEFPRVGLPVLLFAVAAYLAYFFLDTFGVEFNEEFPDGYPGAFALLMTLRAFLLNNLPGLLLASYVFVKSLTAGKAKQSRIDNK